MLVVPVGYPIPRHSAFSIHSALSGPAQFVETVQEVVGGRVADRKLSGSNFDRGSDALPLLEIGRGPDAISLVGRTAEVEVKASIALHLQVTQRKSRDD